MTIKAGWNESGTLTLIASASVDQYEVVKISGDGKCAPAGSGEAGVGVAMTAATATGIAIDVDAFNRGGSFPGIMAASVTAGAEVYTFTGGLLKASTTAASGVACKLGVCINGSTSTGDQIVYVTGGAHATT